MRLGPYELVSRLARGGMGEVFVARRRGPGDIAKRVVIKRIRRDLSGDPRFVEMFLREAQLSMTLSHNNIVKVFDFGRAGPELFLAMEYVEGRDLAHALAAAREAQKPLSPTAVAYVGVEVCRALDYAHAGGGAGRGPLIHRDLSPKNLLLSFAGEVVVADFGLAVSAKDERAGVRGTPAYLSPEQARGEPVDPRADLFSLGLVLREALCGEPDYRGAEPAEIIEKARAAELPPLPEAIPEELAAVIERATRPDREERFDGARAMQIALDEFVVAQRAAGASPPSHTLGDWLSELFPEPLPAAGVDGEAGEAGDVAAVTFLDDGADAVTEQARHLSRSAHGSVAETMADSGALSEPAAAPPPPRRWRWIAAPALAAVAALALWRLGGGDRGAAPPKAAPADAALPSPDAAPAPPPDAAPAAPDAAPAPPPADAAPRPPRAADASPRRPPPQPGKVRVSWRGSWATVKVPGTRAHCAETPCTLELPAGRYTVVLRNTVLGRELVRRVEVRPGKTVDLTVE